MITSLQIIEHIYVKNDHYRLIKVPMCFGGTICNLKVVKLTQKTKNILSLKRKCFKILKDFEFNITQII